MPQLRLHHFTLNLCLMLPSMIECRHLEIRLPMSGLEKRPGCHPERSEGSGSSGTEILRCAQDDSHLQVRVQRVHHQRSQRSFAALRMTVTISTCLDRMTRV